MNKLQGLVFLHLQTLLHPQLLSLIMIQTLLLARVAVAMALLLHLSQTHLLLEETHLLRLSFLPRRDPRSTTMIFLLLPPLPVLPLHQSLSMMKMMKMLTMIHLLLLSSPNTPHRFPTSILLRSQPLNQSPSLFLLLLHLHAHLRQRLQVWLDQHPSNLSFPFQFPCLLHLRALKTKRHNQLSRPQCNQ